MLFRRVASFLMILTLLAGVQASVAPMAMASSGMAMADAAGSHAGDFDGCPPTKMAAGDCFAMCGPAAALLHCTLPYFRASYSLAWGWTNESIQDSSRRPDTSPPRS